MPSEYTISDGDTLWGIARSLGIPLGALQEVNANLDPKRLKVGSQINLPSYDQGTTTTFFDPNTNPQWNSPFSTQPTTTDAPHGNSWGPQTQLMPNATPGKNASPFGVDSALAAQPPAPPPPPPQPSADIKEAKDTPFQVGMPLGEAVTKARENLTSGISDYAKGVGQHLDYPRALASGEMPFDPQQAIKWGVDTAMALLGGGAAGLARVPKTGVRPPNPRQAGPLPEGARRELAGPYFEPNTGTAGIYQKTRGTPTSRRRSTLHDDSMDPLWYDAVINRAPMSALKNTPDEIIPTQSFNLGSNIIRPDFGKKAIPKDPKVNLERRVAKRTGGEVLPQSHWDQAQVAKHAKNAGDERSLNQSARASEPQRTAKLKEEVSKLTPEQWMRVDSASKRVLMSQGIYPKHVKPGSKERIQELIDALKDWE